jgi:hypothetical protein
LQHLDILNVMCVHLKVSENPNTKDGMMHVSCQDFMDIL